MAKTQSWEVSDALWQQVQPLVPKAPERPKRQRYQRRPGGGRKPLENRQIFAGIVYVLRTGCQWKALPKSFGSASSVHKHFQRWRGQGFFLALWQAGLAEHDEMEGIAWEWQSLDGTQGKVPLAQEAVGNNPTDRGKKGGQRSLLVDGAGVPLSLIVSGANRHDVKLLAITLDSIGVERPKTSRRRQQNLCADKGHAGRPAAQAMQQRDYTPQVRQRGEEARTCRKGQRARRWIVERTHSWFNRFRKLLVRYEKTAANSLALLQCAAALICWRMC